MERPIPGTRLSPFETHVASFARQNTSSATDNPTFAQALTGDRMHISVYPNPASRGTVSVSLNAFSGTERTENEAQLNIRSVTGMSVYSKRVPCIDDCLTEIEVDEKFPSGVYILQMKLGQRVFTEKLIIP